MYMYFRQLNLRPHEETVMICDDVILNGTYFYNEVPDDITSTIPFLSEDGQWFDTLTMFGHVIKSHTHEQITFEVFRRMQNMHLHVIM